MTMRDEPSDAELAAMGQAVLGEYGQEPPKQYDPDLIPKAEEFSSRGHNPALTELKDQIDRDITLADVYDHFVRKQRKEPSPGQQDGIMMSCPSPDHPDNDPSAWHNIDGLWYCGSCPARGDIYTIVGLQLGIETRGPDFVEAVFAIADAFNIAYARSPITKKALPLPPTVTVLGDDITIDPPREPKSVTIDWKYLFPKNTFARVWMDELCKDDLPEEYYVWEALVALGLAVGRDVYDPDSPTIYGNLFVVLFGPTGIGKSRAMRFLSEVLLRTLPDDGSPLSKGVFPMPMPGSPEAVIDMLSRPIYEDESEKRIVGHGSVRAFLKVDEFASLLAKSEVGNRGLKGTITTAFDNDERLHTHSRGQGTVVAKDMFLSFISSIQPIAIRSSLSYADIIAGYLNRHIFVIGTPKRLYSMRRPKLDISDAVVELSIVHAWGSQGRQISCNDDAYEVWDEFFHREIETLNVEEHPIMARLYVTLRKILLLLAINDKSDEITPDIVHRTIHLFEYLKMCYITVDGNVVSSTNDDLSEWLATFVQNFPSKYHKPGPTVRDLKKYLPRRFDSEMLVKAIKSAETLGVIVPTTIPATDKGGRPSQRYVYVY